MVLRRPLALGRKEKLSWPGGLLFFVSAKPSFKSPNACHKALIAAELGWQEGRKESDAGEMESSQRQLMKEDKKTWEKERRTTGCHAGLRQLSEASLGGGDGWVGGWVETGAAGLGRGPLAGQRSGTL